MADNYKIFLFEDDKQKEAEVKPKVVRPNSNKVKTKVISVDPKYAIDEKEFEPVIIEHDILPGEPIRIGSVDKEKARLALEEIVRESIKKKKEALALEEQEALVKSKEIPADIEKIEEFASHEKKPLYIKPVDDGGVDITVKLKAHAILSMSDKKAEESEDTSMTKSFLRILFLIITFPLGMYFMRRRRKRFGIRNRTSMIRIGSTDKSSGNFQTRKDLEYLALAAQEKKKERERKEKLMKLEMEAERADKQVIQLDIDNSASGIEVDNSAPSPVKKIAHKKTHNDKLLSEGEKNSEFIL